MKRPELESKYVKNKASENFGSKFYKKERKNYYIRLDFNNVTDNKKTNFCLTVTISPKISLVENDEIISEEFKLECI